MNNENNEKKPLAFGRFISNKLVFAAFFLPVFLWGLAFAVSGVFPFGNNQIAVIDMYHQFVPFLGELQDMLKSGDSLLYSWNGAGGFNFLNLLAYYGASPLNLLLILFPRSLIMEGVTFLLLLKIGFASAFLFLFLDYLSRKDLHAKAGWLAVAFGTLYACCSFIMGYYWCIMWMDVVALFPLCMLGLYKLVDEGKTVLYTVCLALIVFINYYIAIMVCIFIFFYWPVLYFTRAREITRRSCMMTTLKAAGHSVLGIAMAAVMLLPTFRSMQNAYYISSDLPENWVFYSDALDVVNQLLPFTQLTFREGLPNLYCGLIVVIMLVLYFSGKAWLLREKILYGAFLVFLFFSLNTNILDFIWHGFHFPNQLPFRWTFMISFLLIAIAYKTFLQFDKIQEKTLWTVLGVGAAYYLIAGKLLKTVVDEPDVFLYCGLALLVIFSALLILFKRSLLTRRQWIVLICCAMIVEAGGGLMLSVDKLGTTDRAEYLENYKDVQAVIGKTTETAGRTEMDDVNTMNDPALYHYRGVSQFSSSLNAKATAFMEKIGLEGAPEKNRYNYNQTDPVTNAMLNIRYLIGKNQTVDDPDFKLIWEEGNTTLYESKYPLSLGYMLPETIRTWDISSDNPFDVLNDYARAASGNEVKNIFHEQESTGLSARNASASQTANGHFEVSSTKGDVKKSVTIHYTARQTAKHYVFIEAQDADIITVQREEQIHDVDIMNDCGSIVNAGVIEEGERYSLKVDYKSDDEPGPITCHVCTMDQAKWKQLYGILSKDMMQVNSWKGCRVKGMVDASEDGVLVTSIPYENGWSMKVDGKKKEIRDLTGDALISTYLAKGTHQVEFHFMPPGLIPGLCITILSILLLIALQKLQPLLARRRELLSGTPDADEPVYDVRDLF